MGNDKAVDGRNAPLRPSTPTFSKWERQQPSSNDAGGGCGGIFFPQKSLEVLECGVCFELMVPPILQCREGHTVCRVCADRLEGKCATCRDQTTDIRCRGLEKLAESLTGIRCPHGEYGCKTLLRYIDYKEHEAKCQFKPLSCPHPGCRHLAVGESLVRHLVTMHGYAHRMTHRINQVCHPSNKTDGLLRDNSGSGPPGEVPHIWQNQVYTCHGKSFVLRVNRRVDTADPHYFISVIGLHSRHHSNRYAVSAEGNHRKCSFEGPVWTLRKGFIEIERVRDCLMLPENIALFLSGGKGSENDLHSINLRITGEIFPPPDASSSTSPGGSPNGGQHVSVAARLGTGGCGGLD